MTSESYTPHQLVLDDRTRLSLSGVSDVDSFDESIVIAHTPLGDLTVKGSGLHISRLNTESGDLAVEGTIDVLEYTKTAPQGNILRRWFR